MAFGIVSEKDPLIDLLDKLLGNSPVIFGTINRDGKTEKCWLNKMANPVEGNLGNAIYVIHISSGNGKKPEVYEINPRFIDMFQKMYMEILSTFRRTNIPLEIKDPKVQKISDLNFLDYIKMAAP